jgi:hypothetical protein
MKKTGKLGKRHVLRAAIAVGVLWIGIAGTNLALVRIESPLDAVRALAEQQSYPHGELVFLGGGYSNALLSWKAYGEYRVKGREDLRVQVEIARATPLHPWSLSSYAVHEVR